MCSLWFRKKRVYFRPLMLFRVYSNRFLRNHTGMVVPRVLPSCWKLLAFDQIQLDAYHVAVWRRLEATFKLQWSIVCIVIWYQRFLTHKNSQHTVVWFIEFLSNTHHLNPFIWFKEYFLNHSARENCFHHHKIYVYSFDGFYWIPFDKN